MKNTFIVYNDEWNGGSLIDKPNPAHYDDMKHYYQDLAKWEESKLENNRD